MKFDITAITNRSFTAILTILLLALISIYMIWAGIATPWLGDDVTYKFIFSGDGYPIYNPHPDEIRNLNDIFISLYNHFFDVNGRLTAHFLIMFFCAIGGKTIFAICNVAAWAMLASMIIISAGKSLHNIRCWLTITPMIFLLLGVMMQPSIQISYIWMPAIVLLFIKMFLDSTKKESADKSAVRIAKYMLLPILSFMAGNAQETFSIGIGAAIACNALINIRRLSTLQWLMGCAFILGFLLIALSPAATQRVNAESITLFRNLKFIIHHIPAAILLCIILAKRILCRQLRLIVFLQENHIWIIATLTLFFFNLIIPISGWRQLLGIELFSIVMILRILPSEIFSNSIITVLWILTILTGYLRGNKLISQQRTLSEIEKQVSNHKEFIITDVWRNNSDSRFGHFQRAIYNEWTDTLDYEMATLRCYIIHDLKLDSLQNFYLVANNEMLAEISSEDSLPENFHDKISPFGENYLIYINRNNPAEWKISRDLPFGMKKISEKSAATMIWQDQYREIYYLQSKNPFLRNPKIRRNEMTSE